MPKKPLRTSEAVWVESTSRWHIRVMVNGQRKSFYSSTPGRRGKREAEGKADDWLEQNCAETVRFGDAWAMFLADKQRTTGTPNCVKLDSIGRTWLLPALGSKRLMLISTYDWQQCIDAACTAGRSRRTCLNIRLTIGTFVHYALKRNWAIDRDLLAKLDIPSRAPKGERQILQPGGLKCLFSCDTISRYGREESCWYIHAWRFIVATGLRRGELCGLRWADIDGQILHIRRSVNSLQEVTGGKNDNARRDVLIGDVAQEALLKQRAMLQARGIISEYAFPSPRGEVSDSNSVYRHWRTYCKQHGITVTLHELRHTFISVAGPYMPAALLKRDVGHSAQTDTFGIYGHAVEGDAAVVLASINSSFTRALKARHE